MTWRGGLAVLAVAIALVVCVALYLRVSHVGHQVTDVTGLVTDQSARVNRLLGSQLATVNGLLLTAQSLATAQAATAKSIAGLSRNVYRVLRRFQLLFRRLLHGLHGQVPARTAALVASVRRGLAILLQNLKGPVKR